MALSWVKIEIGGVVGEVTALVGKTDDLRARAWPGHGRHGAGQCRAPAGLAHGFETTPTSAANGWARRRPSTLRPPQHGQSKRCDQLDDPVHAVLQPALRQFRGPAVQLVRPSLDIGEHVDDPGQVVKVTTATVPCRGRVRRSVSTGRRRHDRSALRSGHLRLRLRVGVDGQVAVGAEVPGQEIADSPRQRVRV